MEYSLRLPVVCTDEEIIDRTLLICERFKGIIKPQPIRTTAEAIEYINFELPEICLLHYSDRNIDIRRLFRIITGDPWLHSGGIILVYAKRDDAEAQRTREDINIISSIARGRFVASFYRVLKMILLNGQIIFQRELQPLLTGIISSSVEIDNDPFNAHIYANMISNFMCNMGFIDREKRDRLHVILFELVMNAIEHGNCQINYEEKKHWLAEHGDIVELIRQRCLDPQVQKRLVHLSYNIGTEHSRFSVRDEGAGFDWRHFLLKKPGQPNMGQHGHGILMANHYAENLQFNERGNEVCFSIAHDVNHANLMPGFLGGQHLIHLHDGEVLYYEGDAPEQLYYIISGKLKVIRDNSHIATLTPKDMFLGEISVLLNSRRTSTVISEGDSTVVSIKRSSFARIIKQQPYYGIFLARMIARRVVQSRRFIAEGVWWSFSADTPTDEAMPSKQPASAPTVAGKQQAALSQSAEAIEAVDTLEEAAEEPGEGPLEELELVDSDEADGGPVDISVIEGDESNGDDTDDSRLEAIDTGEISVAEASAHEPSPKPAPQKPPEQAPDQVSDPASDPASDPDSDLEEVEELAPLEAVD